MYWWHLLSRRWWAVQGRISAFRFLDFSYWSDKRLDTVSNGQFIDLRENVFDNEFVESHFWTSTHLFHTSTNCWYQKPLPRRVNCLTADKSWASSWSPKSIWQPSMHLSTLTGEATLHKFHHQLFHHQLRLNRLSLTLSRKMTKKSSLESKLVATSASSADEEIAAIAPTLKLLSEQTLKCSMLKSPTNFIFNTHFLSASAFFKTI